MMEPPEPNGDPIQVGELTVEQRVCACCKEPKPRFIVKKDDTVVTMSMSWDLLCKQKGWE